jgi:hypothetical protein
MIDRELVAVLWAQLGGLKAQFAVMEAELERARGAVQRRRQKSNRTAEQAQG